jgi:hypothetical protein
MKLFIWDFVLFVENKFEIDLPTNIEGIEKTFT